MNKLKVLSLIYIFRVLLLLLDGTHVSIQFKKEKKLHSLNNKRTEIDRNNSSTYTQYCNI